jgi:mercuric ion transport protein
VSSWRKQGLLALPGVGISILPKLACPACWPAYAGLLTSVGMGFLISAIYLFPMTAAFLVLALGAMLFRARERHGYGPFLLGIPAAGGVLLGKFVWESNPIMYGAVGLLEVVS